MVSRCHLTVRVESFIEIFTSKSLKVSWVSVIAFAFSVDLCRDPGSYLQHFSCNVISTALTRNDAVLNNSLKKKKKSIYVNFTNITLFYNFLETKHCILCLPPNVSWVTLFWIWSVTNQVYPAHTVKSTRYLSLYNMHLVYKHLPLHLCSYILLWKNSQNHYLIVI